MTLRRPVAIVGIGGLFPGSTSLSGFWDNVSAGVDCAREAPAGRWALDVDAAFDPRQATADKIYSRRACFVDESELDLEGLSIERGLVEDLDPMVRLALAAGAAAWSDAVTSLVDRSRVGVILGNIALPTESASRMADWIIGRRYSNAVFAAARRTPPLDDRGPVASINRYVTGLPAGVLARALGLGGGHFTLDAACASSLFALKHAVDELQAGRADAMLTGGLSRPDSLYTQMGFSQLTALSPSGRCSPFDRRADGLVVGEGAGVVVLKRLDDALAAGDRIHAVIRAIGLSNDVDGNLLAPSREGQLRAMRAAYRQAGWTPAEVDHVECHATGTSVGDAVEYGSLRELWGADGWQPGQCTIGSVKSNVGHLLTGAGAAGLIKTLLAMRHEVLPPTANFEAGGAGIDLDAGPFRVRRESAPWSRRADGIPRRAAVSGFGFGGTNAHVLLEEWLEPASAATGDPKRSESSTSLRVTGDAAPRDAEDDVVIVGMGAACGPWDDLDALRPRVLGDPTPVPPTPKRNFWGQADPPRGWFIEELLVPFGRFRIPPNEIAETLPQQLLMLEVARQALEDARVDEIDRLRTGVFIGIGLDLNTTNYHLRWSLRRHAAGIAEALGRPTSGEAFDAWVDELCDGLGPALNANRVMGNLGGIVASRVAREFAIGGPCYVLSTEESSGLTAFEAAVRGLQLGELDCALVGAVDLAADVRAVIETDLGRPFDRDGNPRPFDRGADGTLPGEGAACLILKRRGDAVRDGDRIYAAVRGVGSATGGAADDLHPPAETYLQALGRAYADAGVDPASIDYIETHGSGCGSEDRAEATALANYFSGAVLGSAKADVGHTGAASGLVSLVKAGLCLYESVLPSLRGIVHPRAELKGFQLPARSRYWLRDDDEAPRRAGVSSLSVTGACCHAVLEAVDHPEVGETRRPLGSRGEQLFAIEEEDDAGLRGALAILAEQAAEGGDVETLARRWWAQRGRRADAARGVAIVCRDTAELSRLIDTALAGLGNGDDLTATSGRRVFHSREPLGRNGEIAFVYPGSGSQYPGMGREIGVQWPEVLRAQERRCARLRSQLVPDLIWSGIPVDLQDESKGLILAQVALGTLVTDVVRSFGVTPDAVVGYSLGETAGLFALGAWNERDEMLRRVYSSDLFTEQLTGPCLAARRTWGLPDEEAVDWVLGVVDRPADEVRRALSERPRAYLLIVNTPDECVIGGQRRDVEAAVAEMGCGFHALHGVTTVHCEVARQVESAYRDLHLLATNADVPVRFYSGEAGRAYRVTRDSAADSVLNQALRGVDYPKVIRQAWQDGVRIFIEMGPGSSCTRMIRKILDGKPFAARAVCAAGHDDASAVLRTLAMLVAERAPVDLAPLYRGDAPREQRSEKGVTVLVGGLPPELPKGVIDAEERSVPTRVVARSTPDAPVRPAPPTPAADPPGVAPLAAAPPASSEAYSELDEPSRELIRANQAVVEAHETYLRLSQRWVAMAAELAGATTVPLGVEPPVLPELPSPPLPRAAAVPEPPRTPVLFDRDQCMKIAIGSIADVLGPEFAPVDSHPTRVRLPDEPLMLVDRILSIDGEPRSMSSGTIVTEHDVLEGAWYLDNGRIPTCVAVEAGQADLFLSGYLGIDFITKGLAVYRLLDAVVTFHDGLPRPGDTIHYRIRIKQFFRQGDTWLFRFEFEATVDGRPLMTMEEGCAGFFTQAELDAGQGIVHSRLERQRAPGKRPDDWTDLVERTVCSLDESRMAALRRGDLVGAFGPEFADLPLRDPLTVPGGRMELVHRVKEIDPEGGRYGIGGIVAEADIRPDDWFLTCHFVDDRVMPGTLMYECCLHTLRIYLLRMGWVADASEVTYEPVVGVRSRLKCRGQVLDTTEVVTYEVSIKEIGYGPEPYAIVDALMYADGKPIVEIGDMSVRLGGLTREKLEATWSGRDADTSRRPLYDRESILAFSSGKPSEAFGEPYAVFDEERVIARLPRPPFQLIDRVTEVVGAPFEMQAGASCVAEVDPNRDPWFFADNRQQRIPFAVLLEMSLQPCGWLAAYAGSALSSDQDLKFRNLGGNAVQRAEVHSGEPLLRTHARLTNVSNSAGMIIQHYAYRTSNAAGAVVYEGDTYFGFFSAAALADQVGVRDAKLYGPGEAEQARGRRFDLPRAAPFPADRLRMLERVDLYVPDGGPAGLGYVRGSIDVDPSMWFFHAHFYQDPVWPGSLGLEAFLQLLKVAAVERWNLGEDAQFSTMPLGQRHRWSYRGQIVPTNSRMEAQACITAVDDAARRVEAEGFVSVDGVPIYEIHDFALEVL